MEGAHSAHDTVLDGRWARDIKFGQEIISYCDQRILWPAGEPVHGTAADQSRELQGTVTEFFPNLKSKN